MPVPRGDRLWGTSSEGPLRSSPSRVPTPSNRVARAFRPTFLAHLALVTESQSRPPEASSDFVPTFRSTLAFGLAARRRVPSPTVRNSARTSNRRRDGHLRAAAAFLRGAAAFFFAFRFVLRFRPPFAAPVPGFARVALSVLISSSHVSGSPSGKPPLARRHVSHVPPHIARVNPVSPRYSSICTRRHSVLFSK